MIESKENQVPLNDTLNGNKQEVKLTTEALKQLLLGGPEGLIINKGSDKALDDRNLKVKLINGIEISPYELRKLITAELQHHPSQYNQEFYSQFFDC